jgi:hypothetical protein
MRSKNTVAMRRLESPLLLTACTCAADICKQFHSREVAMCARVKGATAGLAFSSPRLEQSVTIPLAWVAGAGRIFAQEHVATARHPYLEHGWWTDALTRLLDFFLCGRNESTPRR